MCFKTHLFWRFSTVETQETLTAIVAVAVLFALIGIAKVYPLLCEQRCDGAAHGSFPDTTFTPHKNKFQLLVAQ